MKKIFIGFSCIIIVFACIFYSFTASHKKIEIPFNVSNEAVVANIYEIGLGATHTDPMQISQEDFESILQIISSIKYMNPIEKENTETDPIIYGANDVDYAVELYYSDTRKMFFISSSSEVKNQRYAFFSGWDKGKIVYLKDDAYNEYEKIAKKYLTLSPN